MGTRNAGVQVHAWDVIAVKALPDVSAAANIFSDAPAGTKEIWLTIRTAGLTMTLDGTTVPTAGAVGHDFASDGSTPYVFQDYDDVRAKLVKAIQNGGTATGYITYLG